jgi:hypothetical protein
MLPAPGRFGSPHSDVMVATHNSTPGSAFTIDHVLEIRAPAGRVWAVIADLDAYPAWNPFVVACRSTLAVGAPIWMRVRIFGPFAQPQRETIFEHVAGRRLCYGLASLPFGALASRRCHELEPLGPDRTHYRSHFELRGWLAPLVRTLLGPRLERGFGAMSAALAARAEMRPTP